MGNSKFGATLPRDDAEQCVKDMLIRKGAKKKRENHCVLKSSRVLFCFVFTIKVKVLLRFFTTSSPSGVAQTFSIGRNWQPGNEGFVPRFS